MFTLRCATGASASPAHHRHIWLSEAGDRLVRRPESSASRQRWLGLQRDRLAHISHVECFCKFWQLSALGRVCIEHVWRAPISRFTFTMWCSVRSTWAITGESFVDSQSFFFFSFIMIYTIYLQYIKQQNVGNKNPLRFQRVLSWSTYCIYSCRGIHRIHYKLSTLLFNIYSINKIQKKKLYQYLQSEYFLLQNIEVASMLYKKDVS